MNGSWEQDDWSPQARSRAATWMVRIGIALVLLAFVGVVAWGALSFMKDGKPSKKQIVQLSLLRPPPPPPPPPPPEQKPPEPEMKEEVKVPEPEKPPDAAKEEAPPPGEQLGLDANASGSGDAFGLAARKGGTDITKLGGGSGIGQSQKAWFAGLVQSHLQAQLSREDKLRRSNYRIQLRLWFTSDGRIERFELVDSTGNKELDEQIRLSLNRMAPLAQPPPAGLPQPVKLRLISRGAA